MKVCFENLGVIKKGSIELNNLTLFCGSNNTGKTYAMYTLYALLNKKFEANFGFVGNIVKELSEKNICHYDAKNIVDEHFDEMLLQIAGGLHKRLPEIFGVSADEFQKTKLHFEMA
jgi:predicted ATPase